jgi:hypothetical protein
MLKEISIKFSKGVPSLETIISTLTKSSGLEILVEESASNYFCIRNENFVNEIEIEIFIDKINIYFLAGNNSYFELAILNILTQLGGEGCNIHIPEIVNKKWEELSWFQKRKFR